MTIATIGPDASALAVQPASVSVTHAGLDALHRWVEAADEASQLVARIIDTPFVPDYYRPKVDPRATPEQKAEARELAIANGTAAVLQGISTGLDPLTALQNIYIVHGRPGMYAKLMVALVQAAGHEVWTEDFTGQRAIVAGRRKGTEHIERVVITMQMAQAAGWTRNPNYKTTPADMLWARAAGRVCDRIGADVLKGIAAVEAIQDEQADAQPATRSVRRSAPAPAALPASAAPPLPDADPEPSAPARKRASRKPGAEPEPVAEPELPPPGVDSATGEMSDDVVIEDPPLDVEWPEARQPGSGLPGGES